MNDLRSIRDVFIGRLFELACLQANVFRGARLGTEQEMLFGHSSFCWRRRVGFVQHIFACQHPHLPECMSRENIRSSTEYVHTYTCIHVQTDKNARHTYTYIYNLYIHTCVWSSLEVYDRIRAGRFRLHVVKLIPHLSTPTYSESRCSVGVYTFGSEFHTNM